MAPSERCISQIHLAQVGFLQVGLTQISFLQPRPGEVGFFEMRFMQRDFFQGSPDEFSLLQMGLTQIGSHEQDCRCCTLLSCGTIPLLMGEAAAQARQWQSVQVRAPQV